MSWLSRSFAGRLFDEVLDNGKLLTGYLLYQIPEITSFPGLGTTIKTALIDGTPAAYVDLGIQLIMAIGATAKAAKIVKKAAQSPDATPSE